MLAINGGRGVQAALLPSLALINHAVERPREGSSSSLPLAIGRGRRDLARHGQLDPSRSVKHKVNEMAAAGLI
jgi:hypothetical protein